MRAYTTVILAAVSLTSLAAAPESFADGRGHGGPDYYYDHGPGRGPDHWRGPAPGPRPVMVPDGWHGGHWRHEWYDGRFGWWWIVGGIRYFYPAPIYPYPNPYTPPGLALVPSAQYAYYCGNPAGYYPAVPQCFMPWQMVAVAQPVPPPVAVPAPSTYYSAPTYSAPSTTGAKTAGGTVIGAVGGAVAGAQFGHGSGKLAATAVGTLLGAFVGHEVGASLDRADQIAAQQAAQQAYAAPVGQTITWNTPGNGHSGTITPTREGHDAQNNLCREFTQTVTIDGKQEQVQSTACRKADGTWAMLGN